MLGLSLGGVRVLDLTRHAPGPYATLALTDLGAEVIKIEEPPLGDPLRYLLPSEADGKSVLFELLNRNKRSMTLNLKAPEGKAILRALVRDAQVLLEGFRPGVMERLGLDYAALSEMNRGLVYLSISGYGQTGPSRLRAGHDLNYVALGGLLGITGAPDGPPVVPGVPVADLVSGLWGAMGVLAALLSRERTGHGQHLDLSMTDSVVALLAVPLAEWLAAGAVPARGGMLLSGGQACYNVYETADGQHMALAALEPRFWRSFCAAVAHPDWEERQQEANQQALIADVAALFRTQTRAHWIELFAAQDCCCEPVLTLDEVFEHPQVAHRGLLHHRCLATPLARREATGGPAPALGEHTAEILAELGYAAEAVEELRERGVL